MPNATCHGEKEIDANRKPKSVTHNENISALWNLPVQRDRIIPTNKPDIFVNNFLEKMLAHWSRNTYWCKYFSQKHSANEINRRILKLKFSRNGVSNLNLDYFGSWGTIQPNKKKKCFSTTWQIYFDWNSKYSYSVVSGVRVAVHLFFFLCLGLNIAFLIKSSSLLYLYSLRINSEILFSFPKQE